MLLLFELVFFILATAGLALAFGWFCYIYMIMFNNDYKKRIRKEKEKSAKETSDND